METQKSKETTQGAEPIISFLNDTIDRIEVGDDVTVKLKKNIKVDRDTKKIFTD